MSKKTKLVAAIVIAAASFAVYSAKEQLQQPTSNPPQTTQKQTQVVPPQQDLAQLNYEGTQTIEINQNNPTFSKEELSIENGPWERYGDLDHLNRATDAEALLNKSVATNTANGGTIPAAITAAITTEPPEVTVAARVPVPKT